MISVSTEMPYQEVMEVSVRSGKMKVEKSGHPVKFSNEISFNL